MISVSIFAILGFTATTHISFYIGILEACLGIGDSLGPLLAEYISMRYSYSTQFLFFILILSLASLLTNFTLRKERVDEVQS